MVITHTKSRKTLFHSFELLRVDEALVPIESLKMKDAAHAFAWEPNGHRFGVVHGDGIKPSVSFYSMLNKAGDAELTLLHTLEQKQCNSLHWSPQGQHCILAGTGDAFNGILEFYEASYENFYQFTWRPRPSSLLDAAQRKAVVKNLRKYERKFAHEDKQKDLARIREATVEKRATRKALRDLMKLRAANYAAGAAARIRMRNGVDADADDLYVISTRR